MRLLREGGEIYVGVGYNFSHNRADSRGLWIRRHRCCIGWNCKGFVLCIPGYLRCLLPARPEGKRGAIIAVCWPVRAKLRISELTAHGTALHAFRRASANSCCDFHEM